MKEEEARRLDGFYIPSRYPGPVEQEFTERDAREALAIAARFLETAQATLSS